ncbi:hypothetical protein VCRA219O19_110001 [Vibrio crassostreae]|nr:hypothetical protein VCRA219O19_110001 [Vibrio crassostreae]
MSNFTGSLQIIRLAFSYLEFCFKYIVRIRHKREALKWVSLATHP